MSVSPRAAGRVPDEGSARPRLRVLTTGHSNRSAEAFVALLAAHGVRTLGDVRAYPGSRRWPQFGRDALAASLQRAEIEYVWLGRELGGHRDEITGTSPHVAVDGAFRAYAHHMGSASFAEGIARVRALAARGVVALMCAEKDWRHCHRRMLCDHLAAVEHACVEHVVDEATRELHRVDDRARLRDGALVYDIGRQTELF